MVWGLFIGLKFPYAQFPCNKMSGGVLYPIVWDVVRNLELIGFRVVAVTADGASSNRKFFSMHGKGLINKVKNPYSDDERNIFFFSDVPHLLKTSRNCFANSFAHSMTRQLWVCYLCDTPGTYNLYIFSLIRNTLAGSILWIFMRQIREESSLLVEGCIK